MVGTCKQAFQRGAGGQSQFLGVSGSPKFASFTLCLLVWYDGCNYGIQNSNIKS